MSSREALFIACVASGSGCPSVGGQRAGVVHRKRGVALPSATLSCGVGIGFAHAAGGGALRVTRKSKSPGRSAT